MQTPFINGLRSTAYMANEEREFIKSFIKILDHTKECRTCEVRLESMLQCMIDKGEIHV